MLTWRVLAETVTFFHLFDSIDPSEKRIAYYVMILVSIIVSCCQITLCRVFSYHIQYKCSRLSLDMHQYMYITLNREDQYQEHGYMHVFQTSTEHMGISRYTMAIQLQALCLTTKCISNNSYNIS